MSHFYGLVKGARGHATRCGDKKSGMTTLAASWDGVIRVELTHGDDGEDHYKIYQQPWKGRGVCELIASGVIGRRITE